jgi:hypothetical protein
MCTREEYDWFFIQKKKKKNACELTPKLDENNNLM